MFIPLNHVGYIESLRFVARPYPPLFNNWTRTATVADVANKLTVHMNSQCNIEAWLGLPWLFSYSLLLWRKILKSDSRTLIFTIRPTQSFEREVAHTCRCLINLQVPSTTKYLRFCICIYSLCLHTRFCSLHCNWFHWNTLIITRVLWCVVIYFIYRKNTAGDSYRQWENQIFEWLMKLFE
jgi:hypothetical protein